MLRSAVFFLFMTVYTVPFSYSAVVVDTAESLVAAVRDASEGETIEIAAGTYRIAAPLEPKSGTTLRGAGIGKTIITHVDFWKPSTATLPDPEMRIKGMDTRAYLIRLPEKSIDVSISDLTLSAPQLHGAIFGFANRRIRFHRLRIEDTLWAGIRTFSLKESEIMDCEFVDAGGRWKRGGKPGVDGGITGGAVFSIWMADTEIAHNRFVRTQSSKADEFYGIKGRQGKRCRIHHNTIGTNFSIEFPFENDQDVEIDHNVCYGTISIPKHAGGPVPESGRTFHIHHNWMHSSYAIEFVRNGVEVDHNLFDFDVKKDGGNLISAFGKAGAKGPARFHNNLVRNPGRGVIWIKEPYDDLQVFNNHIISRTTVTPRKEGFFGFNPRSNFDTIRIYDNIIECKGLARPLLRNEESYQADIRDNLLINVADSDRFGAPDPSRSVGPEATLQFQCGVHGEYFVDDWEVVKR